MKLRRRVVIIAAMTSLLTAPAYAQVVVIDVGNLAEVVEIVIKTRSEFDKLREQYETILRMTQALGGMDRYRTVPIALSGHDPSRWTYGAPWLTGLNTGDARGDLYAQIARTLQRPPAAVLAQLPPAARRIIENAYATIEITDSIAQRGAHQVALVRGYVDRLQQVVQLLESDILNPRSSYHQVTTNLDKIAAGELIGRRQDTATNQMLSHVLEQLLAQSKRRRDTEVAAMNMRVLGMRGSRALSQQYIQGSADALRTWRQP